MLSLIAMHDFTSVQGGEVRHCAEVRPGQAGRGPHRPVGGPQV